MTVTPKVPEKNPNFHYKGVFTEKVKELLNNSNILLKWNNSSLDYIIFNKICPECNGKLLYADRWFDRHRIVIFKRLCPTCRRTFTLAGSLENYDETKEYFIRRFRLKEYKKKVSQYRKNY